MRLLKKYFLSNFMKEEKICYLLRIEADKKNNYYLLRIEEEIKELKDETKNNISNLTKKYKTASRIYESTKSNLNKKEKDELFEKIKKEKCKLQEIEYFKKKLEEFKNEEYFDAQKVWIGIWAKIRWEKN